MRYRGRIFSQGEIETIRQIIREMPEPKYRTPISREICRHLNWRKPDGGLKDMACRVALLKMQQDGLVQLPPSKHLTRQTRSKKHVLLPPLDSVCCSLHTLAIELDILPKNDSSLWNAYIEQYHYLRNSKLGGAQLRYIVKANGRPIAFFGFSAAAWKVKPRDDFIGWNSETREKNLHLIVNNSRFLILPSIQVPHLASHLLSKVAKRLPADWLNQYGYSPILLETFVEKDRFKATCYKAANWIYLGETKGRGKFDRTHQNSAPVKTIWVYPLVKNKSRILKPSSIYTHIQNNSFHTHT